MSGGERAYRALVRLFGLLFVGLGIAILVRTFQAGGGPLSLGMILGLAMIAIGVARLWLTTRVDG